MKPFLAFVEEYRRYLNGLGYAAGTIISYTQTLRRYYEYLKKTGREDVREITLTDIKGYLNHFEEAQSSLKKPYARSTLYGAALCLRGFFTFLYQQDHLLSNPAEKLSTLKYLSHDQKRGVFSVEEINAFLDGISLNEKHGPRDRALFELMYSSALRIGDVVKLNVSDVDLKERTLVIRGGKGNKDAYLPFSETASVFLQRYLAGEQNKLMKRGKRSERLALFIHVGRRIGKNVIWRRFKQILEAAGIEKKDRSVHSIRHSTATHLLENGADIKYVSELLRHDNLETTAHYTHLLPASIKREYKSAHPRENKYYEEVTEEYLAALDTLVADLKKKWRSLNSNGGGKVID